MSPASPLKLQLLQNASKKPPNRFPFRLRRNPEYGETADFNPKDFARILAKNAQRWRKLDSASDYFIRSRTIKDVSHELGINVERFVNWVIQNKRKTEPNAKLHILDSGAGLMFLGAGLKSSKSGNDISLTSLDIHSPEQFPDRRKMALKEARNTRIFFPQPNPLATNETKRVRKLLRSSAKALKTATKNARAYDRKVIAIAETLDPEKKKLVGKFDLIFDIYGPLSYTISEERVLENYMKMLLPGGIIAARELPPNEFCDKNSELAKRTGFYFERKMLSYELDEVNNFYVLIKRKV
jgi:hypothetical protein